jgi:hypothetical protein
MRTIVMVVTVLGVCIPGGIDADGIKFRRGMTPAPLLPYQESTMKNVRSLLLLGIVGLGLAACGDSAPSLVAPDAPRYEEGGHTVGSGSKDPTLQPAATSATETLSDSTTFRDGGHTVGSGS